MTCDEVELREQIGASPEAAPLAYPRPDYSQKFRCLGKDCDENCCNGWSIPVDQQTLDTYRQHPTMKPFADHLIVIDTQSSHPGEAARMPLTNSGTCAFLNEEKLCGIHAHFGPGLLSNACATYPREISHHKGRPEAALNLSCPEAARLTLLEPNLLGSGPWQLFGAKRYTHIPYASRLPSDFDPILALRELVLLLISDPTYPLWQRLHIIGDLAQRLEILSGGSNPRQWARKNPGAIAKVIDATTDAVAFHTFSLPEALPDPSLQLRYTAEVIRVRLAEMPVPAPFLSLVQSFQAGLGCEPERTATLTDAQIAHTFQCAYRHHARPLLDRHPQLIGNFLINHIFKYAYPFGRARHGASLETPTKQHLTLVAHLALTQTLLVGLAAHHREGLTTDHVVRLVQSLAKAIEHRPASVAHMTQLLHDQNLTTPAAQAQLLQLG